MTLGEYSYSLLLNKSVILIGLSDISPLKQTERLVKTRWRPWRWTADVFKWRSLHTVLTSRHSWFWSSSFVELIRRRTLSTQMTTKIRHSKLECRETLIINMSSVSLIYQWHWLIAYHCQIIINIFPLPLYNKSVFWINAYSIMLLRSVHMRMREFIVNVSLHIVVFFNKSGKPPDLTIVFTA